MQEDKPLSDRRPRKASRGCCVYRKGHGPAASQAAERKGKEQSCSASALTFHTLAQLARCSKNFHGPAIRVLWSTIPDISPLVLCLPADTWTVVRIPRVGDSIVSTTLFEEASASWVAYVDVVVETCAISSPTGLDDVPQVFKPGAQAGSRAEAGRPCHSWDLYAGTAGALGVIRLSSRVRLVPQPCRLRVAWILASRRGPARGPCVSQSEHFQNQHPHRRTTS